MQFSKLGMLSLVIYSSILLAGNKGADASSASYAYVPNRGDDNVTLCTAKATTGLLTQCHTAAKGFKVPEGVAINPKGDLLYVVNNNRLGTISMCEISSRDGALSGCVDAGGSGFYYPDASAFSPSGSILYTVNASSPGEKVPTISACLVDNNTGKLSSCVSNPSSSFVGPSWIQINSTGKLAYISNFTGNTISVCHVDGQRVFNCNNTSGSGFALPDSITLNPVGNYAYITNNGASGRGQNAKIATKNKGLSGRNSSGLAGSNHKASQIQDAPPGGIIVCAVSAKDGLLSDCKKDDSGFSGSGLAFNSAGSFAYISNFVENTVTVCTVDLSSGGLSNCSPAPYSRYNHPTSVAIKST